MEELNKNALIIRNESTACLSIFTDISGLEKISVYLTAIMKRWLIQDESLAAGCRRNCIVNWRYS